MAAQHHESTGRKEAEDHLRRGLIRLERGGEQHLSLVYHLPNES